MLFMRNSTYKTHFTVALGVILMLGIGIFFASRAPQTATQGENVTVTIPNGLRKEQTAGILADALGWTSEQEHKFVVEDTARDIRHVEGVFPGGTYTFSTASSSYDVASVLLGAAAERYRRLGNGLTPDEWYDVLKVAAIAERETETVADLNQRTEEIWQSWRNNELIHSDATVQYARDTMQMYARESCSDSNPAAGMVSYDEYTTDAGETRTVCIHWRLAYTGAARNYEWWTPATQSDKELQHGYNTYLYASVPQHPIATPHEESIIVAMGTRSAYVGN
jgi:cell division protein YceG involved in septum cleavage